MFTKDEYKWQKKKEEILLCGTIEQQKLENHVTGFLLGISTSLFFSEFLRIALHINSELIQTGVFLGGMAICTYTPGAAFSAWAKIVEKQAAKEAKLHPYTSPLTLENLENER